MKKLIGIALDMFKYVFIVQNLCTESCYEDLYISFNEDTAIAWAKKHAIEKPNMHYRVIKASLNKYYKNGLGNKISKRNIVWEN